MCLGGRYEITKLTQVVAFEGPLTLRVVNPDESVNSVFAKLVSRDVADAAYFQATLYDYVNWLDDQ